ncbi:hypothetical protein [Halorussus salinisoli]|uniref:hypothetical protein n=1 Tax=Halorussus salinisoli TaxID=2558242 RepID=UPI0010C237D9|nr:hypothetical protein [Halorussus salinisoli]
MSTGARTTSRRVVLKTLGAGIVFGGTVTGNVAASDATTANEDTFREQLTTVLSLTHKYQDVDVAQDDGYEKFGEVAEPPVGHVYEKSEYWDGKDFIGKTDIAEPPTLLFYAPISGEDDGDEPDLVLAGVEYTVSGDQTGNPPNLFADEDTPHELKVTEAEGWHRSPAPDVHDVTGLHVWLYLNNPDGLFRKGHPHIADLVSE